MTSEINGPSYLEQIYNTIKDTTTSTYNTIKNKSLSLKQQYWDSTTGGKRQRKPSNKSTRTRIKTPYKRKRCLTRKR
jgi:zona occludens toxin (predicted ATPase)